MGVAVGAALGSATHQMGLWVAAGAAMGIGFGVLMEKAGRRSGK